LQISEDQIELTNANIAQRSELIKNGKMAEGEIYELEAQKQKKNSIVYKPKAI
jgi:outer membrane protein